LNWKVKAILQKMLSTSRIGDKINHLYGSMQKNYYSNGVRYGFKQLFFKLDSINSHQASFKDTPDKTALEIGTGYFIVQPIILRLLGWQKIITVDITRDVNFKAFKRQLEYLLHDPYISEIKKLSRLDSNEFNSIIQALKTSINLDLILKKCNITYLAPYNFEDIESYGIKFDLIFSQVVLEHIPPDELNKLFSYTKNWLKTGGYIIHIINFTDHFTNPGVFEDKNISEFNFLQYSDKYWNFWAGNPIAYTNRLGYPYYFQICEANGLKIVEFIEQNYKTQKPLGINRIHSDVRSRYLNNTDLHELTRVQRGTFVISQK